MLSSLSPSRSTPPSRNHHHHHTVSTTSTTDDDTSTLRTVQKRLDENFQYILQDELMPLSSSSCMSCRLPTHIIVQQLNTRASYHMSIGEYNKAIPMLVSALKLWDNIDHNHSSSSFMSTYYHNQQHGNTSCGSNNSSSNGICCPSCTIDECILQSSSSSSSSSSNNNRTTKDYRQCQDDSSRFVYNQPIVTISKLCQSDLMSQGGGGRSVSLILILNLAIAHHLSGTMTTNSMITMQEEEEDILLLASEMEEEETKRGFLSKALQLYELAHQLQKESSIVSPLVTMIISNNVGEIHYEVGNYEKHTICVEHLLSTIMYMVDHHHQSRNNNMTANEKNNTNMIRTWWDDFLRNTSPLVLQDNCADAA